MAKVVAIVGPTGVGKTALSLAVAHRFNGEVISGDSQQVYRHLDIGTAKILPDQREGIPHYLIDVRDVHQRFSVADFQQAAAKLIPEIVNRGHLPLIVGGTGFYLRALTEGLQLGDHYDAQTRQVRAKYEKKLGEVGPQQLWMMLNDKDPAAAAKIAVGDPRRVIRALEVIEVTGKPFSSQPKRSANDLVRAAANNDYLMIGLNTDRQVLYRRINKRVDQMVEQGLAKEARWLYDQGGERLPAGKGIGYREFFPYFDGQLSLEDAIEKVKRDSRHYAKRQLTWFHNQTKCHWFDLVSGQDRIDDVNQLIANWLRK